MKKLISILTTIAAVGIGFFIVTFIVYFFNLDMKLTAALEPTIRKLQERVPRNQHL